ncbi:hypothetical protein HK107_09365 [Parvularcula sp. ZS-1/3]|uniref:Uncharacterized protein n=1 Tax=Parvularcula mediterranea TaxID=2732508 RepID=A0A7Y3RNH9_9PROT|nr:hypothetical protein [Parvularcula mediterranea]NNU16527.1 hypothetical protein [Parvularcula mediterranea]
MIFRRILEHVRTQNWIAVGIDFVIVVVGVFIGIQLGNWNEERAGQTRAVGYLERLAADLDLTTESFENNRIFREQVRDQGERALSFYEDRGSASDWQVISAFMEASHSIGVRSVRATYEELTSTGDVALLEDSELMRELGVYYGEIKINDLISEFPAYRRTVRGIIPVALQRYHTEHCYETSVRQAQLFKECPAPTGLGIETGPVVASLLSNEELRNELRYWVATGDIVVGILYREAARSQALTDRVRASVEASR